MTFTKIWITSPQPSTTCRRRQKTSLYVLPSPDILHDDVYLLKLNTRLQLRPESQ